MGSDLFNGRSGWPDDSPGCAPTTCSSEIKEREREKQCV